MSKSSFWDRSWNSISGDRVLSYVEQFDYSADEIIRFLREREFRSICDAGCGCGVYALKLAANGFSVSGFDVSESAVALTKKLLSEKGYPAEAFRTGDVLATGCADGQFDAVVSRDVIDHMPIKQGAAAVAELLRIVRPGGCVLLTLDGTDAEYESERHTVNEDGDYIFTGGKWNGMIFHPYSQNDVEKLTQGHGSRLLSASESGFLVALEKGKFLPA
ncbi:MAG: class I SAM-dependent methyltransferase [Oscillospiraceae bacterium]|nr:class I SAM-dependent methyltransferase [Oscillospiraceae bacterium]